MMQIKWYKRSENLLSARSSKLHLMCNARKFLFERAGCELSVARAPLAAQAGHFM
jgi:hypothetical protein